MRGDEENNRIFTTAATLHCPSIPLLRYPFELKEISPDARPRSKSQKAKGRRKQQRPKSLILVPRSLPPNPRGAQLACWLRWSLPYRRTPLAAGSVAFLVLVVLFPRLALQSWYATSIGAATAIDEYVPIRMPITSANENPCSTSPPNR